MASQAKVLTFVSHEVLIVHPGYSFSLKKVPSRDHIPLTGALVFLTISSQEKKIADLSHFVHKPKSIACLVC